MISASATLTILILDSPQKKKNLLMDAHIITSSMFNGFKRVYAHVCGVVKF